MSRRPTSPERLASPESSRQARRPDPVRREHDDRRLTTCERPSRSTYSTPLARPRASTTTRVARAPVRRSAPPATACAPVREVGRRLRARGAALQARPPLHARRRRRDRVRPRPPVPAEVVVGAARPAAAAPDRQRRMGERGRGRQRRVARQPARAELDVGAVEVRLRGPRRRSASRRRRRRASAPGSPTAAAGTSRRCRGSCCRPRRANMSGVISARSTAIG